MITLKDLENRRKLLVLEKSEAKDSLEVAMIHERILEVSFLINYLFQKKNAEFKNTLKRQFEEKERANLELELLGLSKEDYQKLLLESDF